MVYQPDPPFPKARGNAVRSKDWNDTVNEVIRLDQVKLNQTGGTLSGSLQVTGNLSALGTISGNLAAGIVGQGQVAPNAVTTDKIADGSVTFAKLADRSVGGNKIPDGSIAVEKLFGNLRYRNVTFTLGSGVGTELVVELSADDVSQGPTPLICPLMFASSSTPGAGFSWHHFYTRLLNTSTGFYTGSHRVRFVQMHGGPTTIHLTVFLFRVNL